MLKVIMSRFKYLYIQDILNTHIYFTSSISEILAISCINLQCFVSRQLMKWADWQPEVPAALANLSRLGMLLTSGISLLPQVTQFMIYLQLAKRGAPSPCPLSRHKMSCDQQRCLVFLLVSLRFLCSFCSLRQHSVKQQSNNLQWIPLNCIFESRACRPPDYNLFKEEEKGIIFNL